MRDLRAASREADARANSFAADRMRRYLAAMGLSAVAGVFSRFFIVGSFLPSFFALVALGQIIDEDRWPAIYADAQSGTQILILGGVGLLIGLILSSLQSAVFRALSGALMPRPLAAWRTQKWRAEFDMLKHVRDQSAPSIDRTRAARRLVTEFPDQRDRVGPTRLFNAFQAGGAGVRRRWGLAADVAWPRVEALLSAEQRALVEDAQTEFTFLTNGVVWSLFVAVASAATLSGEGDFDSVWGLIAALVIAAALYRIAEGSAFQLADRRGQLIDLHRLGLYKQLGLREPHNAEDEQVLAGVVNRLLTYNEPAPSHAWPPDLAVAMSRLSSRC